MDGQQVSDSGCSHGALEGDEEAVSVGTMRVLDIPLTAEIFDRLFAVAIDAAAQEYRNQTALIREWDMPDSEAHEAGLEIITAAVNACVQSLSIGGNDELLQPARGDRRR